MTQPRCDQELEVTARRFLPQGQRSRPLTREQVADLRRRFLPRPLLPCWVPVCVVDELMAAQLGASRQRGYFTPLELAMANVICARPTMGPSVTSYVFSVQLAEEEDGRWSAWIEALPGCATWGLTREEALRNLQDAAEAYLRDVRKTGGKIPPETAAQIAEAPLIAVNL